MTEPAKVKYGYDLGNNDEIRTPVVSAAHAYTGTRPLLPLCLEPDRRDSAPLYPSAMLPVYDAHVIATDIVSGWCRHHLR
jgi:hypothetical protein